MKIRTRRSVSWLVLMTMLLTPATLMAQGTTNDWSTLKTVDPGSKLVIGQKNGKKVEGKLQIVADDSLTLTVKNAAVVIKRDDVLTVYQVTKKSALPATLIGSGVGAGTGAIMGAIGSSGSHDFDKLDGPVTAGLAAIGAGVGALTGYLLGRGKSSRVLLYASK